MIGVIWWIFVYTIIFTRNILPNGQPVVHQGHFLVSQAQAPRGIRHWTPEAWCERVRGSVVTANTSRAAQHAGVVFMASPCEEVDVAR